MFCPQCGQKNPDGFRFCGHCGVPLPVVAQPAPSANAAAPFDRPPVTMPPPPSGQAYQPWGPAAVPPATSGYAPLPFATAEYGVARSMEYKGVGPRFGAIVIDNIVMAIAGVILGVLLMMAGLSPETEEYADTTSLLCLVLAFGYYSFFEGVFGGTIGKLLLGMRVVNAEGRNCGLGRALVRNLLRIIDALPFAYIVGAALVDSSDKRQRLGDRVAKTYVVAR